MAKKRPGSQISVRVPAFVYAQLEELRDEVVAQTGERKPSQPEVVAALICAARVAKLSQAMKAYRRAARERLAEVAED